MNIGLMKVIFSITEACNFKCKFCFPSHEDCGKGLSKDDKEKIIYCLSQSGCREITFIGGEPTLCKELSSLIRVAKDLGMKTKIITNGTGLTELFLSEVVGQLDSITVSIDSVNRRTLIEMGRRSRSHIIDTNFYYGIVNDIHKHGYELKINTVVNSKNSKEDLTAFINYAKPRKWKLFQVVSVGGHSQEFSVSKQEFAEFCDFHKKGTSPATHIFPATDDFTKGSCTMINHAGRFFDIANGTYNYSAHILDVGVEKAFAQVVVHEAKVKQKMN